MTPNCPVCGHALRGVDEDAVHPWICRDGCGGIWFDHRELTVLLDQKSPLPESLRDLQVSRGPVGDSGTRIACPRCNGVIAHRRFVSRQQMVPLHEFW